MRTRGRAGGAFEHSLSTGLSPVGAVDGVATDLTVVEPGLVVALRAVVADVAPPAGRGRLGTALPGVQITRPPGLVDEDLDLDRRVDLAVLVAWAGGGRGHAEVSPLLPRA